jgi:APA family basic amino acid/polyamine antiporter
MAISIVAAFVGSSLSGARIPFAAAHDGQFLRRLAYVHPRYGTPSNALIFQSVITSVLILVVGKFQALFSLAIVSGWLAYGAAASTIFVFRKRETGETRPFRVPGYPIVPLVFIASAVVILIFAIKDRPTDSFIGAVVVLCGVPIHLLYRRQRRET